MRLGKGELAAKGYDKDNVLGDLTEAIIGAICLDGGLEEARKFVFRILKEAMDNENLLKPDFKSCLQIEVQNTDYRRNPEYITMSKDGPDHAPTFEVAVKWAGEIKGR
ncbi:ribonuclease III, partial [bacterium]|nr:ribonuclease III [bacterium]